jgi:hypothetical protein
LAPPWFTSFDKQLEMAKRCTEAAPDMVPCWHWCASVHAMVGPKSAEAAMCWRRAAEIECRRELSGGANHGLPHIPGAAARFRGWAGEAESGVGKGPFSAGVWRDDLQQLWCPTKPTTN